METIVKSINTMDVKNCSDPNQKVRNNISEAIGAAKAIAWAVRENRMSKEDACTELLLIIGVD